MKIPCPQCGGEVHLRDAEGFPTCPFCHAGLVLDRTGVRPHVLYRPRITVSQVLPLLRKWADRRGAAASLSPQSPRLIYYPFWRYAREGPRRLVAAWPTLEKAWDTLRLPDAEQVFFDATQVQGATVVEPAVPEAAARARIFGEGQGKEGDLVHVPVYEVTARVGKTTRSIAVEACSGTVVCSWGGAPAGVEGMGSVAWLLGAGVAMVAASAAIRSTGLAACVVAAAAVVLYVLVSGQRRQAGG